MLKMPVTLIKQTPVMVVVPIPTLTQQINWRPASSPVDWVLEKLDLSGYERLALGLAS